MSERGVIRNREYAAQIKDFSGLRFGSITPTDMDGYMEYHNKAFVFIEAKFGNSLPPFGQQLALQRLANVVNFAGKTGVALLANHEERGDIRFADMPVRSVCTFGEFRSVSKPLTVRQAVELVLEGVEKKGSEEMNFAKWWQLVGRKLEKQSSRDAAEKAWQQGFAAGCKYGQEAIARDTNWNQEERRK